MTVLVTGGAGFIGSHFIDMLLAENPEDKIVCLDKLTYAGNTDNLKNAFGNSRFEFVKGDICDRKLLKDIFSRFSPETVVNFAAESHVDRSISSPRVFFETNYMGTAALLEASLKFGARRFHQVSTDEVYGDLPLDSRRRFNESSPLSPHSPYSASKASADLLALSYFHTYGLNVTVSRCSNNYGERQYPEKLIPLAVKKALSGEKIPVYGDGQNVRDWIYVKDHCRAVKAVLENGKAGEIYNVSAGCEISNIALIKKLIGIIGSGEIEFVPDRKGHDRRYSVNSEKIYGKLGFSPKYDFETEFEKTVKRFVSEYEKRFD